MLYASKNVDNSEQQSSISLFPHTDILKMQWFTVLVMKYCIVYHSMHRDLRWCYFVLYVIIKLLGQYEYYEAFVPYFAYNSAVTS